jgi:DNA-directed RNA polymerase specialized sigma24 family protein
LKEKTMVEILGRYSRMFSQLVNLRDLLEVPLGELKPLPRHQKQRQVRLSPTQVEDFCRAYLMGMSIKELAKEYGINRNTVHEHLRRQGLPRRHPGITGDQLIEARRLYEGGLSLMKVSQKMGCHAETMRQALIRAGVEIRRRNGWVGRMPDIKR